QLGSELVYLESSTQSRLHILNCVCKTEPQFLNRVRARFADVIAADTDRMPMRHFVGTVFDEINGEFQRCLRRIDVRIPCDVLLQNIMLCRSARLVLLSPLLHSPCNLATS